MAVRIEELGSGLPPVERPAADIRGAYEAFMSGDPYCLPAVYVNYPGRKIIGPDYKHRGGFSVEINPISERIISFGEEGKFKTVLYIPGEHIEGYTFANPNNPWSGRAEALALREVSLDDGKTKIRSIAEIPRSLAGEEVFNLGMMYRAALGRRDVQGRAEVGTELRKRYGLQFRMVGANGPEFWLWGY